MGGPQNIFRMARLSGPPTRPAVSSATDYLQLCGCVAQHGGRRSRLSEWSVPFPRAPLYRRGR